MGYRLKVGPAAGLKLRGSAALALPVVGRTGLLFEKINNVWYGDLDYTQFVELAAFDASQKLFAVYDRATGVWNRISAATFINYSQTYQVVETGDVIVRPNDGLIAINKAVGAATTVTLPLASVKVGPVKIVDFKGDAGTNNITINVQGSDKFSGNLTSWAIDADTGSIVLHPIPSGYAV